MDGLHIRIALTKGRFSNYILKKAQEIGLLPGQPRILEYLSTDDGCSQTAICEAWELDKSTVTGLAKRMERDGLIHIEQTDNDKRKKKLYLTPKGSELSSKMQNYVEWLDKMAFSGFSEEEQKQFMELLERMYQNLKEVDENGIETNNTK